MTLKDSLLIKTYLDPNPQGAVTVAYKAADAFDAASFYCPQIPMGITGTMYTPQPDRITFEIRENQGGYFDTVAVIMLNERRPATKQQVEDIAVWCIAHWGPPGLDAPALWKLDREIIFVHDPRLMVELKLHWHGTQV